MLYAVPERQPLIKGQCRRLLLAVTTVAWLRLFDAKTCKFRVSAEEVC